MRISMIILTLGFGFTAFAEGNASTCSLSAEDHVEQNIGYAVGYECQTIEIVGAETTKLKFVSSANGECQRLSPNNLSTIRFSLDASKEDAYLGEGCKVRATYNDGHSRIISVSAVEN